MSRKPQLLTTSSDKHSVSFGVKILRMRRVIELVGLSRATIYRAMKESRFPQSVQLGPNSVGWLEHEVVEWLDELANQRFTKIGQAVAS